MKMSPVAAGCFFAVLAMSCAGSSGQPAADSPIFHSPTPAGYENFTLNPSGTVMALLGLIECPEIEGAQRVSEGMAAKVLAADGTVLTTFPSHFSFRITASLRKTLTLPPEDSVTSALEPEELLARLKFRMRAYDGIRVREVEPDAVQIIGLPADVPSDERIYRVQFAVSGLPITDRLVLDVLTPEGAQLTHFTFSLL
ncbi:MAG TPA: hypothetical protein VKT33_01510 [Candidatus Angelobacter sp.]|nr:hypothetical protein [Candidatus Angelobacter sp.]